MLWTIFKRYINIFGSDFIDYVICSNDKYDDKVLERYRERNAKPVVMDEHKITDHNIRMITSSNLVEILDDHLVRHNTKVLARLIYDLALEMTSTIQFRPKITLLIICITMV